MRATVQPFLAPLRALCVGVLGGSVLTPRTPKVGLRLLCCTHKKTWPEANIIRNAPPDAGSDHGPRRGFQNGHR
eukprot:scaffold81545_cov35-Phaeocystis_antarctica.AAC.1